jgi:hypothetical protein
MSVRLRGAQPSCTDTARSLTCREGALVLGERGVLVVPAYRQALHRSALSASVSLVRSSKGVDKSAGTLLGGVCREYRLVVLVRGW